MFSSSDWLGTTQQKKLLVDALLAERVTVYPASLAQQRLWFLDQLQGPTAAYNVHVGLWLKGRLDRSALQSSLQEIVNRHDSLRTAFRLEGGELVQVVSPIHKVTLLTTDLSEAAEPWNEAYRLAKEEVETPFDLSVAPLFRARILRTTSEDHVFLCTMHHIVTDAWSLQIFTKELALLYDALSSAKPARLPELPIQYGDYSEWQRQALGTETLQQQLDYWKSKLQNAPPVLELPKDGPRPAEQTLRGEGQTFPIPGEIAAAVSALAGRYQATPFMVLLAVFKTLLYRYSKQPHVLVGVPVAGRNQVETESLIGFFVDTVVLRDDLSGNPQFVDLLAQVRDTTLGALAHADVPFEKVVEVLQPERHLSYNPVFQVMFSLTKTAIRSHAFSNLSSHPYVVSTGTSIFDLSTTILEDSDGRWWAEIYYNTSLFRDDRIGRMFEDYISLLAGITADPETRIDDLPLVSGGASGGFAERLPVPTNGHHKSESKAGVSPAPKAKRQPASDLTSEERILLAEIWKEVLGVAQIGVNDNFFDMGGHSLLAARLVAKLQDATGRKIPVSAIFRAPTIESFGRLLNEGFTATPDPVVMQLSRGKGGIPFFSVAAPGVDTLGLTLLARNMGEGHSVYKLQTPGPLIWGRPFEKEELRALAREYVAAMLTVQPSGPYCLGGMCDGVLIAQEMILELEARGAEVSLFAIFDTWVLENSQIRPLWAVEYYLQRMRTSIDRPLKEQLASLGRVLRRLAGRNGSSGGGWGKAYWPGEDFQPPRFQAPVLLFKRPRQPYFYIRDPLMGWGARSTGGTEICEINCGHYEMLRPPHVGVVGEALARRLQEINQGAAQPWGFLRGEDGADSSAGRTQPMQ
jgi:thioesterase domain-containing protein